MELKNKFALRQYGEHANRVNCMEFASDNRHFISCANETSIKLWDIQNSDTSADISILAAHSDNIKKVSYFNDDKTILSASSDGTVKLWDLRNTAASVSTLKLKNPVEDFCFRNDSQMIIANGNALSVAEVDVNGLTSKSNFYPFQKPATRIRYDKGRDRVVAGGLDSQLKFFNVTDEHQVSVAYKIKVPSEIFAFDFSGDGNHFSMGLADGSLVIKSKMLDPIEEKRTDEQRLMD